MHDFFKPLYLDKERISKAFQKNYNRSKSTAEKYKELLLSYSYRQISTLNSKLDFG